MSFYVCERTKRAAEFLYHLKCLYDHILGGIHMNRVIVEKEVPVAVERESTASNAIWAIAFIVIVGMIVGALYYSGALRRLTSPSAPSKVNVEVTAPAAPAPANR